MLAIIDNHPPPRKRPYGAVLTLLLLSWQALGAADWPLWLGPRGDNSSSETGWRKDWPPSGPPRLFEKAIGGGYSAVVVARGRLVLFHRLRDHMIVSCRSAVTGDEIWKHEYPTAYVDRYNYSGGPRCSPLIDLAEGDGGARVFTLGPSGVLTALSFEDGRQLWRRDLEREFRVAPNFFGVGAAPVLDAERLFVNLGGTEEGSGWTFALEKSSGKLLWKSPTGGGGYAAGRLAEIDGCRHLFIFHRTGMTCFDPLTGKERWFYPWRSRVYESVNATTPVVDGDVLFFSAAYRTGSVALRIKKDGYSLSWRDDPRRREKILASHWSNVNVVDGHVYGFSGRHESESMLTCVALADGNVAWRWKSFLGRGSMLFADGHFIALGERGDLALLKLDPQGYEVVRRVERVLRPPAWTPPVLANGRLYLRDEGKLICMDVSGQSSAADN